ncbi:MAG: PRTRC system ThiF family protein [Anaerolineae bacterium]|nr:PRTRC system ThiF family protein [Anaerolineae bacterium]
MDIQRHYRIEAGEFDRVNLTLVGCGGTGSFLALHLGRLAYHARERRGIEVNLSLVDPDTVEAKNVGRQNFCLAEVGQPKAWALMRRLNAAFGLQAGACVARFGKETWPKSGFNVLRIVVGCVDNGAARKSIAQMFAGRHPPACCWWLDCGNHEHAGQVLLGNKPGIERPEISPMGFCSGLPLPSALHPELLAKAKRAPAAESCADLALREAQGLMINQMIAAWAAQYVYRLVLARDLDIYATYVDLVAGSARSLLIQKENA